MDNETKETEIKNDYKEKQKMYKRMYKERGKMVWVSKERGDLKGRTFVKEKEEEKK